MPDKINYREPLKMVLTSNRAKCLLCGEIIESKHRHHFVPCHCGNLIVDGGLDYLKRIFNKMDSWVDMSETSRTAEGQSEDGREPGNKKKRIKRRKTLVGNKRLTRRRVQKEVRIK
jgi:hypothetical protein